MKVIVFFLQASFSLSAFNNLGLMRSVSKPTLQDFRSKDADTKRLSDFGHKKGSLNIMESYDINCSLIQSGRGRKRLLCGDELAKRISNNRVKRNSNFQMIFQ